MEWEGFSESGASLHLNMTLFYHQIRQQMEEQVAQKSCELEQYLQRVRELEDMYLKLQEALEDERQARQDEETVRKLQARYHPCVCSPLHGFWGRCTLVQREEECQIGETCRLGGCIVYSQSGLLGLRADLHFRAISVCWMGCPIRMPRDLDQLW